ncbi:MAG TPA: M15 family metallopeptidase [Candidatus Saccharimonadales bacterium]|nr:M15 family metallopeptidase [Candidatus Saccharimonadales bacterium]
MRRHKNKRRLTGLLVIAVQSAVVYLLIPAPKTQAPHLNDNNRLPASQIKNTGQVVFDKTSYPNDQAASLWAVVNKGRSLPGDYVPAGLIQPQVAAAGKELVRPDTAAALKAMFEAAAGDGIRLEVVSGYRSFSYQQQVYNGYVRQVGIAAADTFSARPGHSEHQTGLAADIGAVSGKCELDQCFGNTAEGRWLAANCADYGFIIRYANGKDKLTGYEYEPWHVRYVGKDLAAQIKKSGQTLEQFLGLPAYDSYPADSLTLKE